MLGATLDFGLGGFCAEQHQFLQRYAFGLLALETVELVATIGQAFHHQAGFAVGIAAFYLDILQSQHGIAAAQALADGMAYTKDLGKLPPNL
jgi:hypothetical protein